MSDHSLFILLNRLISVGILTLISVTCSAQKINSVKQNHPENGFQNIYRTKEKGFLDFLKWRWERFSKKNPFPDAYNFPLAENDPAFLKSNRTRNTLTWIGHATILLQLGGKNILTDPHFSERASPVQWAGPRRVVPPGIAIEDLPQIDFVFISHDHYDSLDKPTVKKLYDREGGQRTIFYVPLGFKRWFQKIGIRRVIEMDWWEQRWEDQFKITAVPVHHWSKRSLFSRNKSLWAGWIIESDGFRFFFVGDSGYTPLFKEIGNKLGPFDLSAIPIGAYEPRWFMRDHHVNPEEALQIHLDVNSKRSVAIHWGTFILTDEPLDEPPGRLHVALEERGLKKESFIVLQHGETIFLKNTSIVPH